jgi:hypothetical protein
MKALILATLLVVSCSPPASGPVTTPTASISPVAAASKTPVPTAAPTPSPAPGLTRYTSAELGYILDLPAGWRKSACSQGVVTSSPLEASELFIGVPESEEIVGPGVRLINVRVKDANGLTPQAFLEKNASQPDVRFEAAALGGRAGARGVVRATGSTYVVALAERGWIYAAEMTYFGSPDPELERVLMTFGVLPEAALGRGGPTPTPTPRTIESVVDALTDGFARQDVAVITDALAPCITVGAIPGDANLQSRAAYVTSVAIQFATTGVSVRVQARPIENDPNYGRLVRSTWSKPGERDQRVDFVLRALGDRWSVVSAFIRSGN